MRAAPPEARLPGRAAPRAPGAGRGTAASRVAAALLLLLLFVVVLRLPWAGDLGMHAATVERLRHSLRHPGNPLVDADTPSPYYSPWMVLLGCLARAGRLDVFAVLRLAALAGLALLATGVWRYVRTLSTHRAAPALAAFSLVLLWGTDVINWSGFISLNSLALTVSYPSVLALGLAFHHWAWLTRALRTPSGWGAWLGLGVLWAVILLCHQFTGIVATLGDLAVVVAARPPRTRWPRFAAAAAAGALVLWLWPYYDFFALFWEGGDLDGVHRALFTDFAGRYWLALLGVAALVPRLRRDRRDVLAVFFALGALVCAAAYVTGHYEWGRALPAALIPAQLAAALEVLHPGHRRAVRTGWAWTLAAALTAGAWAQAGVLGYVLGRAALPEVLAVHYTPPWTDYAWITPYVRPGDVVMARDFPNRLLPAYGVYTVAPGYPDFFLKDAVRREWDVRYYYTRRTPPEVRRQILDRYHVRWVVDSARRPMQPGLRPVTRGPGGQMLYAATP
jgi:alpha-1,6-mannosyltransferase